MKNQYQCENALLIGFSQVKQYHINRLLLSAHRYYTLAFSLNYQQEGSILLCLFRVSVMVSRLYVTYTLHIEFMYFLN